MSERDVPGGTSGPVEVGYGAGLADTRESWPVTESETVHETGRVISVRRDRIQPPGGAAFTRDVVVHPGAVGVVALDDEERVLLVRQYRHPVRHRLLEPPAGLLDIEGEDYRVAAERELWEEAGMKAADWRVLLDAFTSPGMTNESVRIFLARELSDSDDVFDREHEEADMDVVRAPLGDVVRAILAGDLNNPLLIMGAMAAWAALHGDGFDALRPSDAPWPSRS